jgi:hypothetical protein
VSRERRRGQRALVEPLGLHAVGLEERVRDHLELQPEQPLDDAAVADQRALGLPRTPRARGRLSTRA